MKTQEPKARVIAGELPLREIGRRQATLPPATCLGSVGPAGLTLDAEPGQELYEYFLLPSHGRPRVETPLPQSYARCPCPCPASFSFELTGQLHIEEVGLLKITWGHF
ncbi:hypothetical protein P7K49_016849 [Saguinus oedipus]|uniref:Uncharacterized protein n=1 Tax=Saguinus oedipus TaxID=9490 RepID=A0ABQ9VDV7_SAGOE|nr:hypothetical protein P7K49_016849 [Saguinus oedipus]